METFIMGGRFLRFLMICFAAQHFVTLQLLGCMGDEYTIGEILQQANALTFVKKSLESTVLISECRSWPGYHRYLPPW